jgi:hypothetical protein
MVLTTIQKINIAKISQYLCQNDVDRSGLYSGGIDRAHPRKIYSVRKNVEWMYDLDTTDDTLPSTSNYLYALCGKYALQAFYILNNGSGGNTVVPVSPTPITGSTLNFIELRASDFANATDYIDTRLAGKDLSIIGNWLGSRLLNPSVEWDYIAGGGVRVLIGGFDSAVFAADEIIIRVDINGTIEDGVDTSVYPYNLSAITTIDNLPSGDAYQIRTVVITPNGFDYDWGTGFIFNDSFPEQPGAVAVNTKQIYMFQYIAGIGDVCIGQALNVPV